MNCWPLPYQGSALPAELHQQTYNIWILLYDILHKDFGFEIRGYSVTSSLVCHKWQKEQGRALPAEPYQLMGFFALWTIRQVFLTKSVLYPLSPQPSNAVANATNANARLFLMVISKCLSIIYCFCAVVNPFEQICNAQYRRNKVCQRNGRCQNCHSTKKAPTCADAGKF